MVKYVFKDRPNVLKGGAKASAQKTGETLAAIKARTKGRCNSKTILTAARDKSNYLHRFFDWNNTVAGEKWRLEQARALMSCVEIVETHNGRERRLPAFISLIDRGGRGYHTVQDVMNSDDLQVIALKQAEADFEAYAKRLMQFGEIADKIHEVRQLIRRRREAYEEARQQA